MSTTHTRERVTKVLSRLARCDRFGPLAVASVVVLALVGARLHTYQGNPAGFVQFGTALGVCGQVPPGAPIASFHGDDGQYFWVQAIDPFLRQRRTVECLQLFRADFRASRMAYPVIAAGVAGGSRAVLPWTMLIVNVVACLLLTAAATEFARDKGRSGWWALAVGLTPGLVLPVLRDTSDVLAISTMAAGLMLWERRRVPAAAALLSVAVLAREPMALAVAAIAVAELIRVTARPSARPSKETREAIAVVVIPAVVFVAWQAYAASRFGGSLPIGHLPPHQFGAPFGGALSAARYAIAHAGPRDALWQLAYLSLTVAAIGASLFSLRRRPSALDLAAVLFAVVAVFIEYFNDKWIYGRLTAPLFVTLAIAAISARRRLGMAIVAAATVLTFAIPLAFSGGGTV